MKLILFLLFPLLLTAQTSLESIRKAYPLAGQTAQNAESFIKLVAKGGENSVTDGYKAASQIIKAKFESGNNRRSILTNGIKSLEKAIASDPSEFELRLIRLSIQENLPGIVGYKSNLKEDKNFLVKNIGQQNSSLKTYAKGFIANSKSFSAAEKSAIK